MSISIGFSAMGALKLRDWNLRDWNFRHQRGQKCKGGKCETGEWSTRNAEVENARKTNEGPAQMSATGRRGNARRQRKNDLGVFVICINIR